VDTAALLLTLNRYVLLVCLDIFVQPLRFATVHDARLSSSGWSRYASGARQYERQSAGRHATRLVLHVDSAGGARQHA
jgi:hypothetical protein